MLDFGIDSYIKTMQGIGFGLLRFTRSEMLESTSISSLYSVYTTRTKQGRIVDGHDLQFQSQRLRSR